MIDQILSAEFLGIFLSIAGFVIGLGAVTVIDIHGFLGQKSPYWTLATTRTHKVTKPLIWIGLTLAIIGHIILHQAKPIPLWELQTIIALILIFNGCFLSFYVSPFLLNQEKKAQSEKILPQQLQRKIFVSFILSFLGWWGQLALFVLNILN